MSAYKVVSGDVALINQDCIIQVLEAMGMTVELNKMCQQRWSSHNRVADIVVKKSGLPEHLQGFGDLGLIKVDGKYSFLACSAEDSHYMDSARRDDLSARGMDYKKAKASQPDGKFYKDQLEFLQVIEAGYAGLDLAQSILDKCNDAIIDRPTGVDNNASAWMMQGSVSANDLARLGITITA